MNYEVCVCIAGSEKVIKGKGEKKKTRQNLRLLFLSIYNCNKNTKKWCEVLKKEVLKVSKFGVGYLV